ncbi:hypothetical protein Plhal304r1_c005g0021941 [Plasmopara halstedii]
MELEPLARANRYNCLSISSNCFASSKSRSRLSSTSSTMQFGTPGWCDAIIAFLYP